jgi:hypothetical protein
MMMMMMMMMKMMIIIVIKHDTVSAQLHFKICNQAGLQLDEKRWYQLVRKSVGTSRGGKVTTLWNQQGQTDRTIPNNKPCIVNRNNEKEHVC